MNMVMIQITRPWIFFFVVCNISCVFNDDFSGLAEDCEEASSANVTYVELRSMLQDEAFQIHEDLVLEGYVISSDRAGNFFKVLHLQERAEASSEGILIEFELRDSYLFYPVGSKVFVKLKGLYLGESKGMLKLGGALNSFGTLSVGRIPASVALDHISKSCDPLLDISPNVMAIDSLNESHLNTLVEIRGVEFLDDELGLPYAIEKEETIRQLRDCSGAELGIENSGFSDFQSLILPEGNGSVKGVLLRDGSRFVLKIRDTSDVQFDIERCPNFGNFMTSDSILISEIADPDNNADARFIELYNSSSEDFYLNGWTLGRYTNANTEPGTVIDLTGLLIRSESTLVLSSNATAFENVYGFPPDHEVASNSAADSNGDDNIELIDPFGKVIDRFGIPGEDGTGTNHEFEDGGAFRKLEIQKANPQYKFEEWIIYNDSGSEGTINQPLNAPEDYGPGER